MTDSWLERRVVPATKTVLVGLTDFFGELNDDPDAMFGEYARVEHDAEAGTLTVRHETEPWGLRFTVEPIKDGAE